MHSNSAVRPSDRVAALTFYRRTSTPVGMLESQRDHSPFPSNSIAQASGQPLPSSLFLEKSPCRIYDSITLVLSHQYYLLLNSLLDHDIVRIECQQSNNDEEWEYDCNRKGDNQQREHVRQGEL